MGNPTKELLGYCLAAIGQTMAAIANTPSALIDNELATHLDLLGNVFQASGGAFIVDSEEAFSLEKLGNQLEITGNLVTIISLLPPINNDTRKKIEEIGNIIETLGVSLSIPEELENEPSLAFMFDIYGHSLSMIKIQSVDEKLTNMIAEWSQAIASILTLIKAIREEQK